MRPKRTFSPRLENLEKIIAPSSLIDPMAPVINGWTVPPSTLPIDHAAEITAIFNGLVGSALKIVIDHTIPGGSLLTGL